MKKYVIVVATCDSDIFIEFYEGIDEYDVLQEYVKDEGYEFNPEDYSSLEELKMLFGDLDQSVKVEEVPY